jgi:hypothetical protein
MHTQTRTRNSRRKPMQHMGNMLSLLMFVHVCCIIMFSLASLFSRGQKQRRAYLVTAKGINYEPQNMN